MHKFKKSRSPKRKRRVQTSQNHIQNSFNQTQEYYNNIQNIPPSNSQTMNIANSSGQFDTFHTNKNTINSQENVQRGQIRNNGQGSSKAHPTSQTLKKIGYPHMIGNQPQTMINQQPLAFNLTGNISKSQRRVRRKSKSRSRSKKRLRAKKQNGPIIQQQNTYHHQSFGQNMQPFNEQQSQMNGVVSGRNNLDGQTN